MLLKLLTLTLLFSTLLLGAQEWEQLQDAPFIAGHCNGFGIDGKAYILKGEQSFVPYTKQVWEYTADTDTWSQLADFPGPARGRANGDDWNGKYYYGFGESAQGSLNDLWEFNPVSGEFTELPSCPCEGRAHPGFIAHNDKVFMGGGRANNENLRDWWVYDMITQEWSQKEDIPGGVRYHSFQFEIDGFIYIGGGRDETWSSYNIATEEWTAIDNYPERRESGTPFSHEGKGYILSGFILNGDLSPENYFLEYDPALDTWTALPAHPEGNRTKCSSFLIDEYLYFYGGYEYGLNDDDGRMWRYQIGEAEEPNSIQEIESTNQNISISPNPFTNEISIDFKLGTLANYQAEVYNLLGERVYSKKMLGNETVNLASLSVGVYILNVDVDGVLMSQKIVKEPTKK